MNQPKKIRSCATGQRCLSHYHGTNHPESCTICRECGYYHASTDVHASDPKTATLHDGNWLRAGMIRPMDRVELAGVFHTVTGFKDEGDVVHLDFENIQPQTFNINTMFRVEKSLSSQKNDQTLFQSIRQAVASAEAVKRPTPADTDDWGLQVFDWMEGAIRMLKNREWAEQMPLSNAMLCDLETQISELVGSASRYTEVQSKFRAAVATLESLGYSYPVDGAEQWRPAQGDMPDYIKWEKGIISGLPPLHARIVFDFPQWGHVQTGRVMGISDKHIIISYQDESRDEPEEIAVELCEVTIWPYSEADHNRANELAIAMLVDVSSYNSAHYYRMAYRLLKSGKI